MQLRFIASLLVAHVLAPGLARAQDADDGDRLIASAPCAKTIKDQSGPECLNASSFPTYGHLYPLGPELMIDPLGNVGVGTIEPLRTLDVMGVVRSLTGGFEFPDGSVQTTAQLVGPRGQAGSTGSIGPAGPPGEVEQPEPTTAVGTISIPDLNCDPQSPDEVEIYSLTFSIVAVGSPNPPSFSFTVGKDWNFCSLNTVNAMLNGAQLSEVFVTVGAFEVRLSGVYITGVETLSVDSLVPREKLTMTFDRVFWTWTGSLPPVETDWDVGGNRGNGLPISSPLLLVRRFGASLPQAAFELDSVKHEARVLSPGGGGMANIDYALLRTERSVDALTPQLFLQAAEGRRIDEVEVQWHALDPAAPPQALTWLAYELDFAIVESVTLCHVEGVGLVEIAELSYQTINWLYGGPPAPMVAGPALVRKLARPGLRER